MDTLGIVNNNRAFFNRAVAFNRSVEETVFASTENKRVRKGMERALVSAL